MARLQSYHPVGGDPKRWVIEADTVEDALNTLLVESRRGMIAHLFYLGVSIDGEKKKLTAAAHDGTELVVSPVAIGLSNKDEAHCKHVEDTAYMLMSLGLGGYEYFLYKLFKLEPHDTFKQGVD